MHVPSWLAPNDPSKSAPPNRADQPRRRSPETTSSTGLESISPRARLDSISPGGSFPTGRLTTLCLSDVTQVGSCDESVDDSALPDAEPFAVVNFACA